MGTGLLPTCAVRPDGADVSKGASVSVENGIVPALAARADETYRAVVGNLVGEIGLVLTRQLRHILLLPLLAAWLLLFAVSVCLAQVSPPQPPEAADVRLLIDISGSMKQNDPQNLRLPSVDLLVRLLPDGSRAGVWTFGRYVNMLVPFGTVDDAWREKALERADGINSTGLFTNIGEALEQAATLPASVDARPNIILLTDGMVDIDTNPQVNHDENRRIIREILPGLRQQNFRLHTIALSANADTALLEKLAEETTGTSTIVESADALLQAFLRAFDASAPVTELPLSASNSFIVDASVEEFTALVFRRFVDEDTHLVGPDDRVLLHNRPDENSRWHRADTYDLITVAQPDAGEWKILADIAPESRVTILSNLKLRLQALPSSLVQGAALEAAFVLVDDNGVITDSAFLSMLSADIELVSVEDASIRRTVWTHHIAKRSAPGDGIFEFDLPPLEQAGRYRLTITVDGQTFQRRLKHHLQVQLPFTVHRRNIVTEYGEPGFRLQVVPAGDNIVENQTQVVVAVTDPSGRKTVRPLVWDSEGFWQVEIPAYRSGDFIGAVRVTGNDVHGNSFEYALTPVLLTFQPDDLMVDQTVDAEVQEAQPAGLAESADALVEEPNIPPQRIVPVWLGIGILVLVNALVGWGTYYLIRKWYRLRKAPEPALMDLPVAGTHDGTDLADDEGLMNEFDEEPLLDEFKMDEVDTDDEAQFVDERPPEFEESSTAGPNAAAATETEVAGGDQDAPDDIKASSEDYDVGDVIDDIHEELLELVAGESSPEAQKEFAADMLKAQGLDLEEDEMDDAISNLIAELDGKSDETNEQESPDSEEDDASKTS